MPFVIVGEAGVLRGQGDVPAPVQTLLGSVRPSPEIWSKVTITAGPNGMTANRPAVVDPLNSWLYDLWLCERIATVLGV
jgi:hypothetical protein